MTTTSAMLLLLIPLFGIAGGVNDCAPLSGRNNGYIYYGTATSTNGAYASGTMARLRCNPGYYPNGATLTWCYDGSWSPTDLGSCLYFQDSFTTTTLRPTTSQYAGGCPVAGTPANGTIMYSNGMVFGPVPSGTIATLSCHLGHNLEGVASMRCMNGRWDPDQFGACRMNGSFAQRCPYMRAPENGMLHYSNSTINGTLPLQSTVTIQCLNGTLLYGAHLATCTNIGWNPNELGTCRRRSSTECVDFPPVVGGNISYYRATGYASATLQCHNGTVKGPASAFCLNGLWNPPNLGICNVTNSWSICPLFSVPEEAVITYSNNMTNITMGTTAMMHCLSGAQVQGNAYSTCFASGWQPSQLGTCPNSTTGRECQRLPQMFGSEIIYSPKLWRDTVSEGTNATLKCRESEYVVGPSNARCNNKTWIPSELGICSPQTGWSCPTLIAPTGGQLNYSRDASFGYALHGTNVTLRCLTGNVVNGTGMSTCVSGTWYPSSVGGCGTSSSPNTLPKLCHPLTAPVNGTISLSRGSPDFPAEDGVIAMLVCRPGTYILGSTTSLCTEGNWIPSSLGTCNNNASSGGRETGCNWMYAPHGMYLNWSSINFGGPILSGTQLTANCVNNATITGANKLTCMNGSWEPMRFGTCGGSSGWATGAPCTPMNASSSNVGLIYRSGHRYMMGSVVEKVEHGTLLTAKCYNGTMKGNNVTTCADGKWYPSSIGSCY